MSKIGNNAATLQVHNDKFHIMKNSRNQIFYKCDQCTITSTSKQYTNKNKQNTNERESAFKVIRLRNKSYKKYISLYMKLASLAFVVATYKLTLF